MDKKKQLKTYTVVIDVESPIYKMAARNPKEARSKALEQYRQDYTDSPEYWVNDVFDLDESN